jgi:hypothetical protein
MSSNTLQDIRDRLITYTSSRSIPDEGVQLLLGERKESDEIILQIKNWNSISVIDVILLCDKLMQMDSCFIYRKACDREAFRGVNKFMQFWVEGTKTCRLTFQFKKIFIDQDLVLKTIVLIYEKCTLHKKMINEEENNLKAALILDLKETMKNDNSTSAKKNMKKKKNRVVIF